jgi:hypothetical protein
MMMSHQGKKWDSRGLIAQLLDDRLFGSRLHEDQLSLWAATVDWHPSQRRICPGTLPPAVLPRDRRWIALP